MILQVVNCVIPASLNHCLQIIQLAFLEFELTGIVSSVHSADIDLLLKLIQSFLQGFNAVILMFLLGSTAEA